MIADIVVAVLLLFSGLLTLGAALGLERLPDFFDRMHAPSLATTLGAWAVSLASIVHFSTKGGDLSLHAWLVAILLAITAPVTTVMLARVGLFRGRKAGAEVPSPLREQEQQQQQE